MNLYNLKVGDTVFRTLGRDVHDARRRLAEQFKLHGIIVPINNASMRFMGLMNIGTTWARSLIDLGLDLTPVYARLRTQSDVEFNDTVERAKATIDGLVCMGGM